MKKTFFMLALVVLFGSTTLTAQIQKGNILAGGDIANFDIGLNKPSVFSVQIAPKLAFFVKDNLALGGYVDLGVTTSKGFTSINYGVGGLGRYYFADKSGINPLRHSRIFVEANVGIQGTNTKVTGVSSNTNGLGLGFGPGFAYFITPNIGLETLLKYNSNIGFGKDLTQSNLGLNVGFQIYLPTRGLKSKIESDVK